MQRISKIALSYSGVLRFENAPLIKAICAYRFFDRDEAKVAQTLTNAPFITFQPSTLSQANLFELALTNFC